MDKAVLRRSRHWVVRDPDGRPVAFYDVGLHGGRIPDIAEPISAEAYEAVLAEGGHVGVARRMPVLAVTAPQARLELHERGLLAAVEEAVAKRGGKVRIEWEYATVIERHADFVIELAEGMDWSAELLDEMFEAASRR